MNLLPKITYTLTILTILMGCSKEYSYENPLTGNNGITIGQNCVVNKIIEYDTISRKGASAYNYSFNTTASNVLNITRYDSITQNTLLTHNPQYIGDTIRYSSNSYAVLDATKRLIKYVGIEEPFNSLSATFVYTYAYNATTGMLTTKTKANPLIPNFIQELTTYSYTGNNLTKIECKIPLLNTALYTYELVYNTSKSPKNYISILPDCEELLPYIAVLNVGITSTNVVTQVTTKAYDPLTSSLLTTDVANYSNYTYSNDNYVLSVDAAGVQVPALPLYNGRNKFTYYCK